MGIAMIFADNVRRLRKGLGLSQEQLAEQVGVTRAMVNYYEAGEVWPRPDIVDGLAKALRVPVSSLFAKGDADSLPPSLIEALIAAARAAGLEIAPSKKSTGRTRA